jgi:TonB dependent receptor
MAQNIASLYFPLPNQANNQYLSLVSVPIDGNQIVLKIDQRLSAKNNLSVRLFRNRDTNQKSGGGNIYALASPQGNLVQTIGATDTHSFSPSVLNEFRASYTRVLSQGPASALNKTPRQLGGNYNQDGTDPLAPNVNISGRVNMSPNQPWKEGDNIYQLDDKLSWIKGRHSLKFGFFAMQDRQLTRTQFQSSGAFNFDGSFSGNPMADYILGRPASFTLQSQYDTGLRGGSYAAFAQDDFKINRRLTLNLGLRYELNMPWVNENNFAAVIRPGAQSTVIPNAPPALLVVGDPGVPRGAYSLYKKNFGPRLGFAWDLFGDGKTAIRGGYGMLSRGQAGIAIQHAYEMPPFQRVVLFTPPASFSNPYGGAPDPFPYIVNTKNPSFAFPVQAFSIDNTFRDASIQQFNLNLQRQVGADLFIQVGYVGRLGRHLPVVSEINPAVYGPGATASNVQQRRPFFPQYYGSIGDLHSDANSDYHSLQANVQKRFSHGYTLQLAYTWSKSIDNGSLDNGEGSSVSNPYNYHAGERGLSDFDRRHVIVLNGVWDLPFLKNGGWPSRVFGGWRLAGDMSYYTGAPLSVVVGRDVALYGPGRASGGQRANVVGDPFLDPGRSRSALIQQYFNTAAFAVPAAGQFGNSGRNILTGPGQLNTDLALLKRFSPWKQERLGAFEFRGEAYNLLNFVNLGQPTNNMASPAYGKILTAGNARIFQLGLRYDF